MKKLSKALLLVALLTGMANSAWGQASTEGKDFWVANTIVCQPPTASDPAFPTIAVSAQKACKVTITDYAGNPLATANVAAGSWTRFGDNNAAIDPADYYLDRSKWYPSTNNINATDVYNHADKINNYGLHITATENISVFVIMRTPQYSMDASNALPISALQAEYYLQDFQPNANGVDKPVTMTTILATENNTQVVITPKGNTYGKNNNGIPFTISLNKGQTYYLISDVSSQLAGTHIKAQEGKKIAVYVGSPVTRLPGGVAARDALFEQMMPIDYWGTQFIATRSLQKDGNIIGITATQNGTELKVDGFTQTYINEGETYYILLQGPSDPYAKNLSKIECRIDQVITADAAFIETSCPAAVISYDTGNSFAGATNSEIVNGQGDPSSVWLSPIQQKINRITFGACYTKKTQAHFLNVVTETATCANTTLTAYMGQYGSDWSDKLIWTQVPGNPAYSYARVQIGNNTETINVFTLKNSHGFIAHVYGNGEDESYAYSAGSAAVEQGVSVDGETFTNGYISDTKFCVDDSIYFDAKVGTDEITRVDWDFGDGITEKNGEAQTQHIYTVPGWYDVTAELYGHQVCTSESNQFLGSITFSFRVVRPDTILVNPTKICLDTLEWQNIIATYGQDSLDNLLANGQSTILNPDAACYEDRQLSLVNYGLVTAYYYDHVAQDSCYLNGQWYYASQEVSWSLANSNMYGCDSIITCNLRVLTCLDMSINNDSAGQHICPGDSYSIPYTYIKGDIGETHFIYDGNDVEVYPEGGDIALPIEDLKPGKYTAEITVEDTICEQTLHFPIDLTVYYPYDIFKYKFNNVLAVYKSGYGGNEGYEFTAYQWYRNGEAIEGATESVLYLGDGVTFNDNDKVYVVLTDENGMVLPSCEQTISSVPVYTQDDQQVPARKMLRNRQFIIRRGDVEYDIYGQRIK